MREKMNFSSFRILEYSLEALSLKVENVSALVREFPNLDQDRFKVFMRKFVFFYYYLDCQFEHAQMIWRTFNLENR